MKKIIHLIKDGHKLKDVCGTFNTADGSTRLTIGCYDVESKDSESWSIKAYVHCVTLTVDGHQEMWCEYAQMYAITYTHEEMCKILNEKHFSIRGIPLRFMVSYIENDGTSFEMMYL